jgi:nucleoside-diphosphate-sugar epimerase
VDLPHLRYFPIDEEHPTFTTDPYSFSKEVIEDVGAYYWRRDGITSVALRLPGVRRQEHAASQEQRRAVGQARAVLDKVAALPRAERLERLAAARKKTMEYRRQRPLEYGANERGVRPQDFADDPFSRMYMGARFNFWACVDERDSAQAVQKSLAAEYEGSHVLFINDSHNWLLYDTNALLDLFYPEVPQRKRPIQGTESLVSIDKARGLIGFEPEYSVARLVREKKP